MFARITKTFHLRYSRVMQLSESTPLTPISLNVFISGSSQRRCGWKIHCEKIGMVGRGTNSYFVKARVHED